MTKPYIIIVILQKQLAPSVAITHTVCASLVILTRSSWISFSEFFTALPVPYMVTKTTSSHPGNMHIQ